MKKRYRIGICLVLIICLLFLSACGKKQDPPANNSAQATGEADNPSTYTTDSQIQPSETVNPENGKLVWNSKTLDVFTGLKGTSTQEYTINRLTYDGWQEMVEIYRERHRRCEADGRCVDNINIQCGVVEYLNTVNYSKEYFAENTFLVITVKVDPNNPAVLKDVQYADGSLTCFIELGKPIRRVTHLYKTVYVQIEGVLPETTELKLEIAAKEQPESELALQWKESYLVLPGTWRLWDKDTPKIAKVLTWKSYQAFVAECASHGSTCPTYTEEFFADRSLIVLGLSSGSGSTIYELYDLHYAQGTLTCFVDSPTAEGLMGTANMASWLCFIEVDKVLPEDTEIVLDEGAVIYDYDTYRQKHEQFIDKSIYR